MEKVPVDKKIQAVFLRLDRLEKEVFRTSVVKIVPKQKSDPGKGLPLHILRLRNEGFFKEPRTPKELHEKLLPKYHCELNRVTMALIRLQRHGQLRKASKFLGGRKQAAYVW